MNLAGVLAPLLPDPETGAVIALVGAGGKTSALFGLGQELAGNGVLLTTTTHIFDPRLERGRGFDQVVLDPALALEGAPVQGGWGPDGPVPGRRIVLAAFAEPDHGRLCGIHPSRVAQLRRARAFVIVEADGAKRLSVKAPADHEPVVPASADLVLGLVGLDCLGRPMDAATVHRPERFGPVTGCAEGAPIRLEHLSALGRSPLGLFKGAPASARRVLVLNKADLCGLDPAGLIRGIQAAPPGWADLVLVCSLGEADPAKRVLAWAQLR
jgi:probable selenium-dependent hydroxylase accessory protein YqeC